MSGFFASRGPSQRVTHGGATFDLPILYHRDDAFAAFFSADLDAVRALMPSRRLHPIRVSRRRVAVGVMAFNYIDTSIGPYGEVAVGVPVVHSAKAPPPWLPLALEAKYPGFGALVLHLPVTNTTARDAGRGEWGYTKFVADMRFARTPEQLACELREEDRHILTLRVPTGGVFVPDRRPIVTFSVKDGALVKTTIPQRAGVRWHVGGPPLELGDHPVATELRELDVKGAPLLTRYYVERAGILPAGEVVERDVAPLEGYRGRDREGVLEIDHTDEAA